MTAWLSIIGINEDGLAGLPASVRGLIERAEVLVGGARHLKMVPNGHATERLAWESPLARTIDAIAARRGKRVAVLATGDPMSFGIGVALSRRFPTAEMMIVPAPSAFSLACARLAWPLQEVELVSLHSRPLETLHLHLAPGARVLALSADGHTPSRIAGALMTNGYGRSRMTVFEHMGGIDERRVEASADEWGERVTADFNTVAIECQAGPNARAYSRLAGLPDDAFLHDGQLTKREVRAATLAALGPLAGETLWDVGAGCGSIAIEWLRGARLTEAFAIERDAARAQIIAENALRLGVPRLSIVNGTAPGALTSLARPNAVFIGGGLTEPGLAEACWSSLLPGGRLVANAVSLEGESVLSRLRESITGNLTRLAVSRAEPVGSFNAWRPLMPVTQLFAQKPVAPS
ncbi:MAG: precorrin-6y C5,15-methyltransferase (decarboxylating) subunit CbiE [Alphaproteobacteria bacterium]